MSTSFNQNINQPTQQVNFSSVNNTAVVDESAQLLNPQNQQNAVPGGQQARRNRAGKQGPGKLTGGAKGQKGDKKGQGKAKDGIKPEGGQARQPNPNRAKLNQVTAQQQQNSEPVVNTGFQRMPTLTNVDMRKEQSKPAHTFHKDDLEEGLSGPLTMFEDAPENEHEQDLIVKKHPAQQQEASYDPFIKANDDAVFHMAQTAVAEQQEQQVIAQGSIKILNQSIKVGSVPGGETSYFIPSGAPNALVQEEEELEPLQWIMEEGANDEDQETDFIKEQLKPKDCYVYPMSLSYTSTQKRRMKIIRIITFLLCLYMVVPFDLYIPSHHRVGYFGTDVKTDSVSFDSITSNFTFNLKNCKVFFKNSGSNERKLTVEYGFLFGTGHSFNETMLSITADPTETCIVNIQVPPSTISIPTLVFNLTGSQDNVLLDDSRMSGAPANFSGGLNIFGDVAYIDLQNHYMRYLNVSLQYSVVNLNNIRSTYKNISLTTGIYNDKIAPEVKNVSVVANQTAGNICLYGFGINTLANKSCDVIYNPAALINGTSLSCIVTAYMCTRANTCNVSSTAKSVYFEQYINVSIDDGQVQIKQQASSGIPEYKYESVYQLKPSISIAAASLKLMNLTWMNFYTDTANDRISVLQTVGANYQKTWIYTNKLPLLQAQYWPLAWGSVGLLRPVFERQKVILIDRYCPAREPSLLIDSEVNDMYFNYFPQNIASQVAFVQDFSIFWKVSTNSFGDYVYSKIELAENKTIIACYGLAGAIAFVGALLFVQLFIMQTRNFKRKYNKYLNQQLQLAITKKISARSNQEQQSQPNNNLLMEFEKLNKIVEIRGLCSTKFIIMEPEIIAKKKLKFNFSLFQIPAIALDYFLRKKVQSSLMTFLSSIDECKYQFAPKKMKKSDKSEVSIPLRDFQALYSEFCHRNGYKEINVEAEGNRTLQMYGLSAEAADNQKMPAYTFIRFKTWREKLDNESNGNEDDTLTSVEFFLQNECIYSPFENDYIFFHNLRKAYETFCVDQGIQESNQEQIIGSDGMQNFGAVIKEKPLPKFLLGVKRGTAIYPTENGYPGLIRKPADMRSQLIFKSTSSDGILPNALLVFLLFVIILIVPLVTPFITYLALCEMTRIQSNVHGQILTFFDFYSSNRLDPWWEHIPYFTYAAYAHVYVLLYLIFAFVELISFFMTGYDNNGKFPIQFTFMKRFISVAFYVLLGIFIFFYFALVWFAFVWCLLSAILNPSRFLPYSAAGLAFIGTLATKYVIYKAKYTFTMRQYQIKIAEQLANLINNVLGQMKLQGAATDVVKKVIKNEKAITVNTLNQSIGMKIENAQDVKINNANELALVAQQSLDGLNANVLRLSIASIIKDHVKINEFIATLSKELKIDPEFLKCIAEIVQSEFNPSKSGKQISYGVTEKSIKKLFKYLFPKLNVDQFDKLISVILERDPQAIITLLEQLKGIDVEVFQFMNYIKNKDVESLKVALIKEHRKLMDKNQNDDESLEKKEEILNNMFKTLDNLREGEIYELLNEQSDLVSINNEISHFLGFKLCFIPLCIIGFNQNSSTITNQILSQTLKEILSETGMLSEEDKKKAGDQFNSSQQTFLPIERSFLALLYLINGAEIDMFRLSGTVRRHGLKINGDMLELLQKCSITYSAQSFEQVLIKLNCAKNRDILKELYQMMFSQKVNFPYICNKLGVLEEYRESFTFLIYLLYQILSYEMIMYEYTSREEEELQDAFDLESLNKEIYVVRKKIKQCIDELQFKHPTIRFQDNQKFKNLEAIDPKKLMQQKIQSALLKNVKQEKLKKVKTTTLKQEPKKVADQEDEDKKKQSQKIQGILKKIFSSDKKNTLYQDLWKYFIDHEEIQRFISNKDILQMLKAHAIVLLRVNNRIKSSHNGSYHFDYYTQSYKDLAKFYDIQEDKFELIIDIVNGDPKQLFKIMKNLDYNIKNETNFKGTFDPKRTTLLSQLLSGSKRALTTTCLNWYHQYQYFDQGKKTVPEILTLFNISYDFVKILQTKRLTIIDDDSVFFQQELEHQIKEYLTLQLNDRLEYITIIENGRMRNAKLEQKFASYCTAEDVKTTDEYFKPEQDVQVINVVEDEDRPHSKESVKKVKEIKFKGNSMDMITVLQFMLKLKSYDSKLLDTKLELKKAVKDDKPHKYAVLLSKLMQLAGIPQPHKYFKILSMYAKSIPFLTKVKGNWSKDIEAKERPSFTKFNLLLHASQFNQICNKSELNPIKMNKVLVYMTNQANKASDNEPEVFAIEDRDFHRTLQALYENFYFIDIADRIFECLHEEESGLFVTGKNRAEISNNMLGVLLGSALSDKGLVVDSISACLKDQEINLTVLEGLGAVLTSNTDYRDQIMYLCNQLEIEGNLLIKLMDLKSKVPQNLSNIVMDLFKNHDEEQSKICTSFIYTIKGDLSLVKVLAQQIGIDSQLMTALYAAAQGNFALLGEFYSLIQEKLYISSQQTVRYLLQLAHGNSSVILQLSQKRSKNFQIYDPELVGSLFNITFIGKRMFNYQTNLAECEQIKLLDSSLNSIAKKLCTIFKLEKENMTSFTNALRILVKSCWGDSRSLQILYKKLQKYTDKTSLFYNKKQGNKDGEVENELTQFFGEKEIIKYIKLCLRYKVQEISQLKQIVEKNHKNMLKKLRKVFLPFLKEKVIGKDQEQSKEEEAKKKEKEKKKKEAEEKKKKEEIEKKDEIVKAPNKKDGKKKRQVKKKKKDDELSLAEQFKKENAKNYSMVEQFQTEQEKEEERQKKDLIMEYEDQLRYEYDYETAQQETQKLNELMEVGCTFGYTLYKMIDQPLYYCLTCSYELEEENLGVCLCCKEFCHKGHELIPANYGQNIRSYCDCGAGNFDGCDLLNSDCIFYAISKKAAQQDEEKKKAAKPVKAVTDSPSKKKKKPRLQKCSVLRQNFNMLKAQVIEQQKKEILKQLEEEDDTYDTYKKTLFTQDLIKALQLQKYFKDDELNTQMKEYLVEKNGAYYFKDSNLLQDFSVVENMLLLAFGQVSQSFLTFFGNKESYKPEDYDNQDPYIKAETTNSVLYNTITTFVAIAQGDFSKIQHYGSGLAEVLGEKGTKDLTAQDKFSNLIRIAQGGKLPVYDQEQSSLVQLQRNSYGRIFKDLFGINGKSVMIMHFLLTLSNRQFNDALGLEEEEEEDEDVVEEHEAVLNYEQQELKNLQEWIEYELFTNFLQLTDKSIEFCKNIVGIICNNERAFDFIAKEKDISTSKADIYKALLITKKQYDLLPIFQQLSSFIPVNLSQQLRKVFKGDMKSIIEFIIKLLSLKKYEDGSWAAVENFGIADSKLLKQDKEKLKVRKQEFQYLQKLYMFMIGEIGDIVEIEKNLELIWTIIYNKKFDKDEPAKKNYQKEDQTQKKFETFKKRIINTLLSITGFLYNEVDLITRLLPALQIEDKLQQSKFQSLIACTNNNYVDEDIRTVIEYLYPGASNINQDMISYCQSLLQATTGDLISLARIEDELILDNNTHLRSFIVSSITGQTKFDYLSENSNKDKALQEDIPKFKNLLMREAYRIFEKIARGCHGKEENIEQLIKYSFDQKVPLHLMMLLSNDKNLVEKLFSMIDEFIVNRKDYDEIEKCYYDSDKQSKEKELKKYLKQFIDFMNPYNTSAQMKPVLLQMKLFEDVSNGSDDYFLKINKLPEINSVSRSIRRTLGIKKPKIVKFNENFVRNDSEYFMMDRMEHTSLFYDAFSLDRIAINYFQTYLLKQYQNSRILANLLQIIHKQIDERPFFEYLNSMILLTVLYPRLQKRENQNHNYGYLDEYGNLRPTEDNNDDNNGDDDDGEKKNKEDDKFSKFSLFMDDSSVFDEELDPLLINNIKLWFEILVMLLSKDISYDQAKLKIKFYQVFEGFYMYHQRSNERRDDDDKKDKKKKHPLLEFRDHIDVIVDITVGFQSIIRGDFANMQPLAVKLGGFPETGKGDSKLDNFVKFVRDNRNAIKFEAKAGKKNGNGKDKPLPVAAAAAGDDEEVQVTNTPLVVPVQSTGMEMDSQVQMQSPGAGFMGDDPMKLIMLPKSLYEKFTAKKGLMSFDEFKNFVRLLGMNVSDSQIYKIFAMSDKNKTGELDFSKFKDAIIQLKNVILMEKLTELGVNVTDMAIAGTFSIVILLLLFGFIFVGIEAFAPSSSFSSVTNTALPLVAGGAVNNDKKEGENEVDQDAIDITSSQV